MFAGGTYKLCLDFSIVLYVRIISTTLAEAEAESETETESTTWHLVGRTIVCTVGPIK